MSAPPTRLLLLPRLGGDATSDFYPWLSTQLRGQAELTVIPAPDPHQPSVSAWPARIAAAIGSDLRVAQRTFLLGHSVGCLAALHALTRLDPGARAGGALLVAGFFSLPRQDPVLQPWVDTPLNLSAARDGARRFTALVSTDDPFSPEAAGRRQVWVDRLGASVRVEPGAGHFRRPWEPAVLDAARALLSG